MKINVGRLDQILRLGISFLLIYIGFIDEVFIDDTLSSYIIGGFGVVNLIVAILRTCPVYSLASINTNQAENK